MKNLDPTLCYVLITFENVVEDSILEFLIKYVTTNKKIYIPFKIIRMVSFNTMFSLV